MATIKDVSEYAGVSQATVSRVVNGSQRVSPDKKQKVEQAIASLGYRPNSIAQALASNRTGSIGVVVPELNSSFYADMLQGVEDESRQFGYHLIVTSGSIDEQSQIEAIEFLLSRKVDALILHTQYVSDDYLIELSNSGVSLALLNRYIPELSDSCIELDNELGAKLATEHLIDQGHREIACITGPLAKPDARARLQGYREALEGAGITYSEALVVEAQFTEQTGATAMNKLLNRDQAFTALFAANDHMAFGAFEALKSVGKLVPEDISLVGFDNIDFARYLTPALTTVNFPVNHMSTEAVRLVLKKLGQSRTDIEFKLSPSLVVRESVKTLTHNQK